MALRGRSPIHLAGADDEMHRSYAISRDRTCQRYLILAINHYLRSLQLDVKHVYQSLPRLLSLWFEFTAIKYDFTASKTNERRATTRGSQLSEDETLSGKSGVDVKVLLNCL